jgi:hypothetical protein
VLPYPAGAFVFQATNSTNPTLDLRGGIRPGGLTQSGTAVYAVRWTGSGWLLNNATIVGGRTVNDAVTNGGTGTPPPSPVVTSATAQFSAADVGDTVAGKNIPPGAVITSVDAPDQIHISIPTVGSATGGTLVIGPAVVGESNPNLDNQADSSVYLGVRYLANVIDSTEPSYAAARDLVGFDATPSGVAASPLCRGTKVRSSERPGSSTSAGRCHKVAARTSPAAFSIHDGLRAPIDASGVHVLLTHGRRWQAARVHARRATVGVVLIVSSRFTSRALSFSLGPRDLVSGQRPAAQRQVDETAGCRAEATTNAGHCCRVVGRARRRYGGTTRG